MLYKSIRFKIILSFSLIFSCIFLFSGIFIYQKIKENIINSDNQELLSRCQLLASKTKISPLVIPLPNKNELIKIDYIEETLIRNLFTSKNFFEIENIINIEKPLNDKENAKFFSINNKRIAMVEMYLSNNGKEKLRVFIAKDDFYLNNEINKLFYILFFSNLISLIISSLVSYFLVNFLLKPINNIIDTTRKINAAQKMSFIKVPQTGDEIQKLSETINEMLIRIENSLNEQNNFFASASHELKTPLTILKTEIEVNLKNTEISPELRIFLLSQLEEVSRLNRLVEDFLLITQLNNQTLNLRFKNFDLDELLFNIVSKLNNLLKLSNLNLNIILDENIDDFNITGDYDKLFNVFINLIENAIKYASSKTLIEISLKKESENNFLVEVKNKIDKKIDNIDKITEEFYRADVLKDGHGLGLWISNKIIVLHKGKITFIQEEKDFIVKVILPN
ncbi:MAG: HAMP domain-containing sensor histidine kinase [Candidatus Sericytochromatia bacterium]